MVYMGRRSPDCLVDGIPDVARGEAQLLAGVLRRQGGLGQELLSNEGVAQHAQGQAPGRLLRGIFRRPGSGRETECR